MYEWLCSDVNKSIRLEELEATVARLETALQNSSTSVPPPIPPKGLPPSPQPNSEQSPPPLPPPLPPLYVGRHPMSKTPQPPHHPPPTLAHTPCVPNHPPPTLPLTPHVSSQPPSLNLLNTPPPPQHPPPQLPRRESQQQTLTLPSSSISKSSLLPVSTVVHNNADLVGKEGKMTTLAVALAREAFFGEEVMAQCTAKGYGNKPGLPHNELMSLKEEIRKLYPNYWNNPLVFEEKWNKCSEQISQACNRARSKRKKKGQH